MAVKKKQYVVATIKPWNIANFKKHFGKKRNFHLISKRSDLTLKKLRKLDPRYVFFPHWSWIIPKEIWQEFDCVTIHETDLPYGRGGSPIQNLIARGQKQTKISAIKIDKGIDTGDVYLKRPLSLKGSAQEIFERISDQVFTEIIPHMVKQEPKPRKQKGKATVFKRRTPDMSVITGKESPKELYDLIRMLDADSYPHASIVLGKYTIEFRDAQLNNNSISASVEIKPKSK